MTATKSRPGWHPGGGVWLPALPNLCRSDGSVSRRPQPGRFISAGRWRLLAVVSLLAAVAMTACSEPPPSAPGASNANIRTAWVKDGEVDYFCIVYDRKAGYAGMGGLWCERRTP